MGFLFNLLKTERSRIWYDVFEIYLYGKKSMRCLAHFELESELTVANDSNKLQLHHPKGNFELRIGSCASDIRSPNPYLAFHLIFDAPDLKEAEEISLNHLLDALNILTLVTNSRFEYRRLVKIVDWTPGLTKRHARVFNTFNHDAHSEPLLNNKHLESVAKILALDLKPEITRALRWFRLGVAAETLEEAFQFYWFALEIIANLLKPTEKINDKCPICREPLYCKKCNTYPNHRPYPKQAIRLLVSKIIHSDTDRAFNALDKARNALMHGESLEDSSEFNRTNLVDTLGQIAWQAILKALPPTLFDGKFLVCYPTTYIRRKIVAATTISCSLPDGPDGEPMLSMFPEIQISLTSEGHEATP